jgi:Zn-dependent M16 (insulinase) family peptidase
MLIVADSNVEYYTILIQPFSSYSNRHPGNLLNAFINSIIIVALRDWSIYTKNYDYNRHEMRSCRTTGVFQEM